MNDKKKLEELKKIAVEKLVKKNEIEADFLGARTKTRLDLDRADNDHKCAVNDYGRSLHEMKSSGRSESDEIDV